MIALLSDIHGNYPALSAVLARLDRLGVNELFCLGDTAGWAPQINECCAALRERGAVGVRGNHDDYLVTGRLSGRSATADLCIAYQRTVIETEHLEWLGALPLVLSAFGIEAVHGGWDDPLEQYLREPSVEMFTGRQSGLFASGHTHVPLLWEGAGIRYCNPGSVGQPRDSDPRASFAIVDGESMRIERVEYDIEATRAAIASAGLPDYVGSSLPLGLPVGSHCRECR
ncbi:MAG: metallophosphoesterase [Candidatus Leucobacter sulfamidivorax]|nr:metallophosphoesterase [Candidatus Leucobacter sulfamidivorax]